MFNLKALSHYVDQVTNKPFLLIQLIIFKIIGFVFSTNYHRFKFFLPMKFIDGTKLLYMYELFIQRNPDGEKFYKILENTKYRTLLDLGANIGSVSQYFLKQGTDRQAILIEPQEKCYDYLKRTIDPYRTQIYNIAAGGVFSKSKLFKKNELDVNASIFIIPHKHFGMFSKKPKKNESISMTPIDALDFKLKIDLIKINIEGGEPAVIEGMEELIYINRPDILFDPHSKYNLERIKILLNKICPYKITKIDEINYLAVPK